MKALSFRQPWAELVLQGRKTMDLRTYTTHYRGPLAVHAAKTVETVACQEYSLDPAHIPVGGFVGVVELIDVVPLNEETYATAQDQHLAGRHFQPGMFGWVLANPRRIAPMLPAPGRTNLFEAELPGELAPATKPAPDKRKVTYTASLDGVTPERPFALYVQPIPGASTDYALRLAQRVVERPNAEPHVIDVVTLAGDNLRAVAEHVLDGLRRAEYKVTDLSPARRKPFYLPEEVGVRIGLVFLAVKPITKMRRVEEISLAIRLMPTEEVYYWYSKCLAQATAERAQKALRVLLAEE